MNSYSISNCRQLSRARLILPSLIGILIVAKLGEAASDPNFGEYEDEKAPETLREYQQLFSEAKQTICDLKSYVDQFGQRKDTPDIQKKNYTNPARKLKTGLESLITASRQHPEDTNIIRNLEEMLKRARKFYDDCCKVDLEYLRGHIKQEKIRRKGAEVAASFFRELDSDRIKKAQEAERQRKLAERKKWETRQRQEAEYQRRQMEYEARQIEDVARQRREAEIQAREQDQARCLQSAFELLEKLRQYVDRPRHKYMQKADKLSRDLQAAVNLSFESDSKTLEHLRAAIKSAEKFCKKREKEQARIAAAAARESQVQSGASQNSKKAPPSRPSGSQAPEPATVNPRCFTCGMRGKILKSGRCWHCGY